MCGITGILHSDGSPASPVVLRRMTESLAHRGPDGDGVYHDGPLGLGHRRLAIIDLSAAGHQPMLSSSGRFVLTYNGEIYNYQELRLELEALGHRFRSRTDSEVLLNAFVEWGIACLERLNGMFAFAVWDRERQELFLARDRYGVKPLYYTDRNGVLLFGSEVKAILQHPAYDARIDRKALLEYMTFQNLFTDRTLFAGVRLLPAGSYLRLHADRGDLPAPVRYWDYSFSDPDAAADPDDYAEELDRLFRQAVSRQLVSDAPVGVSRSPTMAQPLSG